MGKQINTWIKQAEETWLEILHHFSEELFSTTFLPSHDQTHHRRVWNICKALIREMAEIKAISDQSLVEGILIAAYFHDLGMVHSTREDHGSLGRNMCESFFTNGGFNLPARFDEVLSAIELHDIKDRKQALVMQPGTAPGILDMISIADDLEAMGIIGIYRYTEIYLKRDKHLKSLGLRILGNAGIRYQNLLERCKYYPGLISAYHAQVARLISFFDEYNQQILVTREPENNFYGNLGVVNYIRNLSVEGNTKPADFLSKIRRDPGSRFVTEFFTTLNDELEKARE